MRFPLTIFKILLTVGFIFVVQTSITKAQSNNSKTITIKPRVVSPTHLKQGKAVIHLWGTNDLTNPSPQIEKDGIQSLRSIIGGQSLNCTILGKKHNYVQARCLNINSQDVGELVIRNGFATADLENVYDTKFEQSYLDAENTAMSKKAGIWNSSKKQSANTFLGIPLGALIIGQIICMCLALLGMIVFILEKLNNISENQTQQTDLAKREKLIKEREMKVVATMIIAELKANISKIDAYLTIYKETMSELKNNKKNPRYKKLGDIIQKQPSLDRAIYNNNLDSLQVLDEETSSKIIHFYSRIKNEPDYENIEPDENVKKVIEIVSTSLANAEKMKSVALSIIESFENNLGITEETQP